MEWMKNRRILKLVEQRKSIARLERKKHRAMKSACCNAWHLPYTEVRVDGRYRCNKSISKERGKKWRRNTVGKTKATELQFIKTLSLTCFDISANMPVSAILTHTASELYIEIDYMRSNIALQTADTHSRGTRQRKKLQSCLHWSHEQWTIYTSASAFRMLAVLDFFSSPPVRFIYINHKMRCFRSKSYVKIHTLIVQ